MAKKTSAKKSVAKKSAAKKESAKKAKFTVGEEAEAVAQAELPPASSDDITDTPADGVAGFGVTASRHFSSWMASLRLSLAFTTYQAGKLFLVGLNPETGRLAIEERTVDRCMGIAAQGNGLYVASRFQIWRFENALPRGQAQDGYDAVYVPKASHVTGDIDTHEMAIDGDGRLIFVNCLFSCLARLSRDYSFHPIWQPTFVSTLAPEDRCHLNGMALVDGVPAYVTSVSTSDVADGWRDRRTEGGVVVDVRYNEVICENLSMPHSPRWHDGKLWLQESGTGFLGYVDPEEGRFEPVVFCPGYMRGMAITNNFAVVAISKAREAHSFGGLKLEENLKERDADARCGLLVIELNSGNIVHWLRLEGIVEELFDVAVLPGVIRPRAVGFVTDEIARTISLPPIEATDMVAR